MNKHILAEEFINASDEYSAFQAAMMDAFEDNPIMSCLLGNMHKLADAYYMSMIAVYQYGYTLDEVLGRTSGKED